MAEPNKCPFCGSLKIYIPQRNRQTTQRPACTRCKREFGGEE